MKGKKGILTFDIVDEIPKLLFLIVIVFIILYMAKFYVSAIVISEDTRTNVFVEQLLYSREGIIYVDPITNRPSPGIIDLGKFNSDILDNMMSPKKSGIIAAELKLKLDDETNKKAIYNDKGYRLWLPRTFGGDFVKKDFEIPVLYEERGQIKKGLLDIEVITRKD